MNERRMQLELRERVELEKERDALKAENKRLANTLLYANRKLSQAWDKGDTGFDFNLTTDAWVAIAEAVKDLAKKVGQ